MHVQRVHYGKLSALVLVVMGLLLLLYRSLPDPRTSFIGEFVLCILLAFTCFHLQMSKWRMDMLRWHKLVKKQQKVLRKLSQLQNSTLAQPVLDEDCVRWEVKPFQDDHQIKTGGEPGLVDRVCLWKTCGWGWDGVPWQSEGGGLESRGHGGR